MTIAPGASVTRDHLLTLEGSDVHVWQIDLAGDPWPDTGEILATTETERAARFKFTRDRDRYLRAHLAMRILLGAYLGVRPESVPIMRTAHNKPVLDVPTLGFNLSHSGDSGLLAISRKAEIGVDVEMLRLPREARRLAKSVFSFSELAALTAIPNAGLATAFFNCWTRKEAYLKALGVGLSIDPSTVTVGIGMEPLRLCIPGRDNDEYVDIVSIGGLGGRAAALAVVGGFAAHRIFDYDVWYKV